MTLEKPATAPGVDCRDAARAPTAPGRVPRTPALDGLRGLAIVAVALFHYPTHNVFMGGLFGVGVFFVLSGFLITPILTEEHRRLGRVRVGEFLRRRAWRLLPALLVFLAAMLAATAVFGHDGWFTSSPFGRVGPGAPLSLHLAFKGAAAALSYTYNLFLARDYTMPQPFGHLWTLAVEGQFYVLWALVIFVVMRRGTRALMALTVAVIAISAVSPFLAWDHGTHRDWIYFASLPQAQQLLAGSLLALLWSSGHLRRLPPWSLRLGATLGGAAMLWLVFRVANVTFKYLGAQTVVAGATILVVAHLVDERTNSLAQKALSSKPAVWLGQRSYALYLWHWPFAEWTNQLPHGVGVPLGLTCSVAAADLSWRLVEIPAQRLARKRRR